MARPISYDPHLALERAMDLFWIRGYHAVSVAELVEYTGLNRHSMYARYGSKYGLLKGALHRYYGEIEQRMREILESPLSPRGRLEALFAMRKPDVEEPFWRRMLDRGCLAQRTLAELRDAHPELASSMAAYGERLRDLFVATVRAGQELGEFRTDRSADELGRIALSGFASSLLEPTSPDEQLEKIDAFLGTLN